MKDTSVKYRSICETLRAEIVGGKYGRKKPFPSEVSLMRRFGVARHTILRAIWELRAEGLVVRRQGKGTFVSRQPGRTGRIALVVHGSDYCEIFAPIMREISHICHENGYSLLLGDVNVPSVRGRAERVVALVRECLEQGVDGVIFQPVELLRNAKSVNARVCSMLDEAGVPLVLLDSDIVPAPNRSRYDLVGIDHFAAGRRLAAHLIEAGAKRVAYLMQQNRAPCVNERRQGMKFGCGSLPLAAEPIFSDPSDAQSIHNFLRRHRPDAIACYNDLQAAALIKTLSDLKHRVPDDIMVAGFDDVNCATLVSPQLTTLRQPCAQIARHAVEMLIARIAAPDIPPRALFLSAPLVVRESTSGKTKRVKPKKGRGKEI